ncbi:hypothetical protein [Alicyclobacillus sp. SO9]|uniref:hypothetical protein n=1 Tax=Alicyclobacillus sp. SO9 TaxID=2665646 RepID=UPI0018E77AD3|nr:hypothetical protein [Alicyclobacillus sp. SO9]QQE79747.1 hypothetical protein GI364_04455 [Alicyclobacillus sp. SO9]
MSEDKFPVNLDTLTDDISTAEKEKIWSELEKQIDETPSTKGMLRSKINPSRRYKTYVGPLGAGLVAAVLVAVAIPVLLRQAGHVQTKTVTASNRPPSVGVRQVATEAVVFDQVSSFPWRIKAIHGAEELTTQAVPRSSKSLTSNSNTSSRANLNTKVQYNAAAKKQWLNNGQNLINDLFIKGTPAYNHEMKTLTRAVQNANGSNPSIDGGVASLHWSSVSKNIFNGVVTLKGAGEDWAVYAQWQQNKDKYVPAGRPTNKVNYTVKLKNINGKWMVQSLGWKFAKGSGP